MKIRTDKSNRSILLELSMPTYDGEGDGDREGDGDGEGDGDVEMGRRR